MIDSNNKGIGSILSALGITPANNSTRDNSLIIIISTLLMRKMLLREMKRNIRSYSYLTLFFDIKNNLCSY